MGSEKVGHMAKRARTMRNRYAGMDEELEAIPETSAEPIEPIIPDPPAARRAETVRCDGWPFDANKARTLRKQCGLEPMDVDLDEGVVMRLVPIPAGAFLVA